MSQFCQLMNSVEMIVLQLDKMSQSIVNTLSSFASEADVAAATATGLQETFSRCYDALGLVSTKLIDVVMLYVHARDLFVGFPHPSSLQAKELLEPIVQAMLLRLSKFDSLPRPTTNRGCIGVCLLTRFAHHRPPANSTQTSKSAASWRTWWTFSRR